MRIIIIGNCFSHLLHINTTLQNKTQNVYTNTHHTHAHTYMHTHMHTHIHTHTHTYTYTHTHTHTHTQHHSSELLVVHRFLLQDLSHIPSLPRSIQVDELLTTLERFFPSLPLYGPHLASARHQSLQKEYRTCLQRPQFKQLLEHCQGKCGGRGLLDFLNLPSERVRYTPHVISTTQHLHTHAHIHTNRSTACPNFLLQLSDYVSLLSHFLGAHMRNLSDAAVKRAEILVNYLNKLKYVSFPLAVKKYLAANVLSSWCDRRGCKECVLLSDGRCSSTCKNHYTTTDLHVAY